MKTRHDGDCSIYASLVNGNPEDGICNCGYGLECMRKGNYSEMYSGELTRKLDRIRVIDSDLINKLFMNINEDDIED